MSERQHTESLADAENIICLMISPSFQMDGPLEKLPVKRAHSVDVTKQGSMQIKKKAIWNYTVIKSKRGKK